MTKYHKSEANVARMRRLFIITIFSLLGCTRAPELKVPKTLLFSPIPLDYLADSAREWKQTGFDGFLLSGIMSNWADDIWAVDGDSTSRGNSDETLRRLKSANSACEKVGIKDNFIKVAFYSHLPLWRDTTAWNGLINNFAEAACFARMGGCRGLALDIEYVSEQYQLDWPGYDFDGYTANDLRQAALLRGEQLVKAMLAQFPQMVFLTLPEGITFYGPLAGDFFAGMIKGLAEEKAPGGLHLLTERSYSITSTLGMIHYALALESTIIDVLPEKSRAYWKQKCSIVPGGWPLGYYRKITDENGKFLGWSGRKEVFGDSLVGSYADKSQRFPPQEFRSQYAGLLLAGKQYCWIYGHGATWWQFDEDQLKKYGTANNSALPVDSELDSFKAVVREKWLSTQDYQELATLYKRHRQKEFLQQIGLVPSYRISGPFGGKACDNFETLFPPESQVLENSFAFEGRVVQVDMLSGYLDFTKYYRPKDWVCAYAYFIVESPADQPAQIRLGSNDSAILWVNGVKMLSKNVERSAALDADIVPVRLRSGRNSILVKVCNTEGQWGLYVRLTNGRGKPLKNISYSL